MNETRRQYADPSFRLLNGAAIERIAMVSDESCTGGMCGVVLAFLKGATYDQWVTWTVDGLGNCTNGHYFDASNKTLALADYRRRVTWAV